jgi:3-deoxy-D-manno-octulosonic-acid transferase
LPLAQRLVERGCKVLVTSGTVTSAAVVARRLPRGALHQYVPLDLPAFVKRFLDHWRPDLAIFAESELWPMTIVEAHRRRIPLVLVNGRMSRRSFERWRRLPGTIRSLLARFDLCLAQSAADATRFVALDAPRVSNVGNLKFDTPPPPADRTALASLQASLKGRPVWLAASTHPGEEEIFAAAHRALRSRFPGLLTIIAPRHPERGGALSESLASGGLAVVQRSRGFLPDGGTDIYIADTVGELGLFYRAVSIVLVGGTMVAKGGQNPIEPAKLGCAILHGPHVENFIEAFAVLDDAGGAKRVREPEAIAAELGHLLGSAASVDRMAAAALEAVSSLTGALDRTMAALDPYLMQIALERR